MQEQKKEKLKILVIDWLIILGVYLFVRLMFIMFGLHLNNTLLGICLAVFPCLLVSGQTEILQLRTRSACLIFAMNMA